MIKFITVLLVTALFLGLSTFLAFKAGWISEMPSFFSQTLFFLVFTTLVIFVYLVKANQPDFFVQLYLLTIVVKFLAYGAYITWMILDDKAGSGANVAFFLALYLIFTALEVGFLYQKISGNNGSRKEQ